MGPQNRKNCSGCFFIKYPEVVNYMQDDMIARKKVNYFSKIERVISIESF